MINYDMRQQSFYDCGFSGTARGSIGRCGRLAWWLTGGAQEHLTPKIITFLTSFVCIYHVSYEFCPYLSCFLLVLSVINIIGNMMAI